MRFYFRHNPKTALHREAFAIFEYKGYDSGWSRAWSGSVTSANRCSSDTFSMNIKWSFSWGVRSLEELYKDGPFCSPEGEQISRMLSQLHGWRGLFDGTCTEFKYASVKEKVQIILRLTAFLDIDFFHLVKLYVEDTCREHYYIMGHSHNHQITTDEYSTSYDKNGWRGVLYRLGGLGIAIRSLAKEYDEAKKILKKMPDTHRTDQIVQHFASNPT